MLRVGVIGASADRGWAKVSHVPAIQHLEGLELYAVASGSQEKADAARLAFGASRGYADALDLIADKQVDLVTVAVKVPDHRELVLAALQAGKHVYCEWPLGTNVQETDALVDAAREASGRRTAIGLQMRRNPLALRARALLTEGAIGRTLSVRLYATAGAFGPDVEDAMRFAENPGAGVTLVSVQGAHVLDLIAMLLGEFAMLNALASTQYPQLNVGKAGEAMERQTPDHLLVQARTVSSVPVAIEVVGGRPPDDVPFRLEITGDAGELVLEGGAIPGAQAGRLRLQVSGRAEVVAEGELTGLPDTAVNVAGIYAALRDDIRDGTALAPDFDHAARLARLVEDVMSSSATGSRVPKRDWPRA